MGRVRSVLDTFFRVLLFIVAAGAMLLVCGGIGWYMFGGGKVSRGPVPTPATGPQPTAQATLALQADKSLQGILVGLYLQLRQGDVNRTAGTSDTPVSFTIEPGEPAAAVAAHLAQAGLVVDPDLFSLYMRHYKLDASLEAGNYVLRGNMTMPEVAQSLQHSKVDELVFTVPEGWRFEQLGELLGANGIVDTQQFINFVRQGTTQEGLTAKFAFLQERPPGAPTTLEGFLFPDTYRVPKKSDVKTIVEIMLGNFGRKFNKELQDAAKQQGKTAFEVVSLASIIEREAVIAEERPVIASVYLNRLSQGKALEADPTVQYALGYRPERKQWWTPLTLEEVVGTDSLWNTYRHPGLPPGPICNPGLSAIQAALNPAQTNYVFFLAKGDGTGTHAFAVTWEEHLQNQQKYQQ